MYLKERSLNASLAGRKSTLLVKHFIIYMYDKIR